MLEKFGRPSHATVVAYMALFIALGGVSYAAITLPINSVGSKQIKRGAVKNSDLGKSAVTTGKVKDGSLLAIDFEPGQLVAGAPGATGPQGPQGAPGTNGTNGTNGATNVTVRQASGTVLDASVSCLAGERATGGGGRQQGNGLLNRSQPTPDTGTPTGWTVSANVPPNGGAPTGLTTAYVICATP